MTDLWRGTISQEIWWGLLLMFWISLQTRSAPVRPSEGGPPFLAVKQICKCSCIRRLVLIVTLPAVRHLKNILLLSHNSDKLLLHTIVVGLTVNDYSLNLNYMAKVCDYNCCNMNIKSNKNYPNHDTTASSSIFRI